MSHPLQRQQISTIDSCVRAGSSAALEGQFGRYRGGWDLIVLLTLLGSVAGCAPADEPEQAESVPEPGTVEWKIQNAMSAAPEAISRDATILDWAPGATPPVLRQGTNGWTCFPTGPDVPSNDPKCVDETAGRWSRALGARVPPELTTIGVSYMLAGGATSSWTDPFLTLPLDSDEWREDPPHVMVIFPVGTLDTSELPTDASQGGPWIHWAGTPYAHIMVPIPNIPLWSFLGSIVAVPHGPSTTPEARHRTP